MEVLTKRRLLAIRPCTKITGQHFAASERFYYNIQESGAVTKMRWRKGKFGE
jgi:hypothetical protein